MYFSKLPKDIQQAIFQLTKDKEFQHRFATDKELDELDSLKNNPGFTSSLRLGFIFYR